MAAIAFIFVEMWFAEKQSRQCQDDAGGTVTALRGAFVQNGPLNRARSLVIPVIQTLDGNHMLTFDFPQWQQAGIHRSIGDGIALPFAHQNQTGSTNTFATTFLNADDPLGFTQKIQHYTARWGAGTHSSIIKNKINHVARCPLLIQ